MAEFFLFFSPSLGACSQATLDFGLVPCVVYFRHNMSYDFSLGATVSRPPKKTNVTF